MREPVGVHELGVVRSDQGRARTVVAVLAAVRRELDAHLVRDVRLRRVRAREGARCAARDLVRGLRRDELRLFDARLPTQARRLALRLAI